MLTVTLRLMMNLVIAKWRHDAMSKCSPKTEQPVNFTVETTDFLHAEKCTNDRVADGDILAAQGKACPSLNECWESTSQNN
jgi:hypothetical protein